MHRPIHAPKHVIATVVGGALLLGAAAPAAATAAGGPVPTVAQLQAALSGVPGVTASEVQALVGDLTALANGGSASNLGADLGAVLTQIGQASGQPGLVQPVVNTVNGLAGIVPSTPQIAQTIAQLEELAGSSGIPAPVGAAVSQLASELTGADLAALLGQAGSPLSAPAVQQILSELAGLQRLPSGGSIPTGALSAVAQALDTIAAQPGVPATAANALEGVAAELASGGPISPATLTPALQTLAGAMPALQSTPGAGPAFSSVLGALTTQLAASPPASGANGGGGAAGAPGGAGGGYVQYLQSPATAGKASTGATIRSLSYRKAHVRVTVACPATAQSRCQTTVFLKIGSSRMWSKQFTIARGKARTASVAVSHKATKGKRVRTVAVTATAVTGSYATTRRIHIHVK